MLLNLKNFSACPCFDDAFFLYYEDFDFCRRYAQQGHRIGVTSQIQITHAPSSITRRNLPLKLEHSTYSYLVVLQRYTQPWVVTYRLGRILAKALRISGGEPETAIAIIKGVVRYGRRVSGFGQSNFH
jgi:GT2 family glycosyltransferase